MKIVIIFAALISLSYQTSTTPVPHITHPLRTTHEPSVHAQFTFHYDYITHKGIIFKSRNCYIFSLSDQERIDVHTDTGLRTLEVKLLSMTDSTMKTEVQMSSLDHHIQQLCGNGVVHYYTLTTSTTPVPHVTHPLHTTHEPSVHAQFIFHYDYITHKMIIISRHQCYIFTLSDQERIDVHTDAGIRALEAKLLPMIDSTTKTEVQMSSLDNHIQQICGKGVLHYYTFA